MPLTDEDKKRAQELYASLRSDGLLDKNPRAHELVASLVKDGTLRDLSGGSVYPDTTPKPQGMSVQQGVDMLSGTPRTATAPAPVAPAPVPPREKAAPAFRFRPSGSALPPLKLDAATQKAVAKVESDFKKNPQGTRKAPAPLSEYRPPVAPTVNPLAGTKLERQGKAVVDALGEALVPSLAPAVAIGAYEERQNPGRPSPTFQNYLKSTGDASGVFGRSANAATVPVIAGLAGAGAGAEAVSPLAAMVPNPIGKMAVEGIGGAIGAAGGSGLLSAAQEALLQKLMPSSYAMLKAQQAADVQQHPDAARLGGLAPMAATMSLNPLTPGISEAMRGMSMQEAAKVLGRDVAMRLGNAAIPTAINAVIGGVQGQPISGTQALEDMALFSLLPNQNPLGQALVRGGRMGAAAAMNPQAVAREVGNARFDAQTQRAQQQAGVSRLDPDTLSPDSVIPDGFATRPTPPAPAPRQAPVASPAARPAPVSRGLAIEGVPPIPEPVRPVVPATANTPDKSAPTVQTPLPSREALRPRSIAPNKAQMDAAQSAFEMANNGKFAGPLNEAIINGLGATKEGLPHLLDLTQGEANAIIPALQNRAVMSYTSPLKGKAGVYREYVADEGPLSIYAREYDAGGGVKKWRLAFYPLGEAPEISHRKETAPFQTPAPSIPVPPIPMPSLSPSGSGAAMARARQAARARVPQEIPLPQSEQVPAVEPTTDVEPVAKPSEIAPKPTATATTLNKSPWEQTSHEWLDSNIASALSLKSDAERRLANGDYESEAIKRVLEFDIKQSDELIDVYKNAKSNGSRYHKEAVEDALKNGFNVPAKVLNEYPDLAHLLAPKWRDVKTPPPAQSAPVSEPAPDWLNDSQRAALDKFKRNGLAIKTVEQAGSGYAKVTTNDGDLETTVYLSEKGLTRNVPPKAKAPAKGGAKSATPAPVVARNPQNRKVTNIVEARGILESLKFGLKQQDFDRFHQRLLSTRVNETQGEIPKIVDEIKAKYQETLAERRGNRAPEQSADTLIQQARSEREAAARQAAGNLSESERTRLQNRLVERNKVLGRAHDTRNPADDLSVGEQWYREGKLNERTGFTDRQAQYFVEKLKALREEVVRDGSPIVSGGKTTDNYVLGNGDVKRVVNVPGDGEFKIAMGTGVIDTMIAEATKAHGNPRASTGDEFDALIRRMSGTKESPKSAAAGILKAYGTSDKAAEALVNNLANAKRDGSLRASSEKFFTEVLGELVGSDEAAKMLKPIASIKPEPAPAPQPAPKPAAKAPVAKAEASAPVKKSADSLTRPVAPVQETAKSEQVAATETATPASAEPIKNTEPWDNGTLTEEQRGLILDTIERMRKSESVTPRIRHRITVLGLESNLGEEWAKKFEKYLLSLKDGEATPATVEPAADTSRPAIPALSASLLRNSHSGTSFSPERRAQQEEADYRLTLEQDWDYLSGLADSDEARATLRDEFSRYAEGYASKVNASLAAHGRIISVMITGPARFPVARNDKANESYRKRLEEQSEFRKRALTAIKRKIAPETGAIMAGDKGAVESLKTKLQGLIDAQESMKKANAIVRRYYSVSPRPYTSSLKPGKGEAGYLAEMKEAGFTEAQARDLAKPGTFGDLGFASYSLSNNNANIARVRERIAGLEAMKERGNSEQEWSGGVRVEEDAEDARIRILFPGKPSPEAISALKSGGFRWSPSSGAWQRQLNNNGRWAVQQTLTKLGYTKQEAAPVKPAEAQDVAEDEDIPDEIRTEAEEETPAPAEPAKSAEPEPTQEELQRVGLLREPRQTMGGEPSTRWQYRNATGSGWMTSNTLEGALEMAREAYAKTPVEDRIASGERVERDWLAAAERQYGRYSIEQLEAMRDKAIKDAPDFANNEISNGYRYTSRAVANEGRRQALEEARRIDAYLKYKQEQAQAEPDELASEEQAPPRRGKPDPATPDPQNMPMSHADEGDMEAFLSDKSNRLGIAPLPYDGKPLTDPITLINNLGQVVQRKIAVAKQKRNVRGSYRMGDTRTTIKWHGDVETTAHEVGHSLDDELGLMKPWAGLRQRSPYDAELFVPELLTTAKDSHTLKVRRAEAVAEWFRLYAMNPDEAARLAPTFAAYVKKSLPADVLRGFDTFGREARRIAGAPAITRAEMRVQWGEGDARSVRQRLTEELKGNGFDFSLTLGDKLQTQFQDSLKPAVVATQWARELTGAKNILPERDPLILFRLHADVVSKVTAMLEDGFRTADGKRVTDPQTGATIGGLDWLVAPLARNSVAETERLLRLTSILGLAERTIEKGAQLGRAEGLTGLAYGLFDDVAEANALLAEIRNLPQSDQDDIEEGLRRYRVVADSALDYLVDSGRMSQDDRDAIKTGNQKYIALQRLRDDLPLQFTGMGRARKFTSVAQPVQKFEGSRRRIKNPYNSLIEGYFKSVAEGDRNRAMDSFFDPFRFTRGLYDGPPLPLAQVAARVSEPIPGKSVKVYHDGELQHWEINDPNVYNALAAVDTPASPQGLMKVLATLTAGVPRALITASPEFAVRNVLRDAIERPLKSEVGSTPLDSFRPYDMATRQEFRRYGGGGGHYLRNRKDYEKALRQAVKDVSTGGKSLVYLAGKKLPSYTDLLHMSEEQGRLAEYTRAYKYAMEKLGYDEHNAALYGASKARELIDFAVSGNFVRQLSPYIPFMNASIQGFTADARAVKRNPALFAMRFAMLAAASVIPLLLAEAMGKRKEYEALPAYQRDLFFNIPLPVPDAWLRIPKGFTVAVVASAVERAIDSQYFGNKDAFIGYLESPTASPDETLASRALSGSLAQSLLPVKLDDLITPGGALGAVSEIKSNYDNFRQRNIVPPFEAKLPVDVRRGADSASRAGQLLAKVFSTDPRVVDHFITSTSGGLGKDALILSDLGRTDKPLSGARVGNMLTGLFTESPGYGSPQVVRAMSGLERAGVQKSPLQEVAPQLDAARTPKAREEAKATLRAVAQSPEVMEAIRQGDERLKVLSLAVRLAEAQAGRPLTRTEKDMVREELTQNPTHRSAVTVTKTGGIRLNLSGMGKPTGIKGATADELATKREEVSQGLMRLLRKR